MTPESRVGIELDGDGVCQPCRYAEFEKTIDWDARWKELVRIAERAKRDATHDYDCVVGVSGGKDSTRQAMIARDELGLRPLCVAFQYPPEQLTEIGPINLSNLIQLGFDVQTVGPAPEKSKAMMRLGFRKYGNPFKTTERALFASVARMAIKMRVPLAFLGENPAMRYGDVVDMAGGEADRFADTNTLAGGRNDEFVGEGLSQKDMICYTYPSRQELAAAGVRMYFMGYYIRDFNNFDNADFAIRHGLTVRGDPLEDIGAIAPWVGMDDDIIHVNQMIKHIKFGNGMACDLASEAVQLGRLSREEAIRLVCRYDGKIASRFIRKFCRYLQIDEDEFWDVVERFRHPELWQRVGNDWRLKHPPK